jgi:hypothetical protein
MGWAIVLLPSWQLPHKNNRLFDFKWAKMAIVIVQTWTVMRMTEDLIVTMMETRIKIRRTMTPTNI